MLAMSRGKTVEPLRPLTLDNKALYGIYSTLRRFDVRWLHTINACKPLCTCTVYALSVSSETSVVLLGTGVIYNILAGRFPTMCLSLTVLLGTT